MNGSIRKDASVTELAEHFDCTAPTVLSWIRSGRLKAYLAGGTGAYRVPWAEVERAKQEWMYKPDTETAL